MLPGTGPTPAGLVEPIKHPLDREPVMPPAEMLPPPGVPDSEAARDRRIGGCEVLGEWV